jgi:hypothetical protein
MYRREEGLGSNASICISHDLPGGWDEGNHWSHLPALHLLQVSPYIDISLIKELSMFSFTCLYHHFTDFHVLCLSISISSAKPEGRERERGGSERHYM